MTSASGNRRGFLAGVRRALGHAEKRTPESTDSVPVDKLAEMVHAVAADRAGELMTQLERSAAEADWQVFRAASVFEATDYIEKVIGDLDTRLVVTSSQAALRDVDLDDVMTRTGVERLTMTVDRDAGPEEVEHKRAYLRQRALEADLGITGVDHAIAETGSCVLLPRQGLSRLVSLLPPAYVAIVRRGQVLPGLDELFALLQPELAEGSLESYGSIITGPSRTADIEQTLTVGVHGPGEVHMILLDEKG